nr:protein PEP-RELATED DEVELOPMENT ARRESTED 1, chloroplastic [Ipomoea batatas]
MASLWFPTLSSRTNLFSASNNANSLQFSYRRLPKRRSERQNLFTQCTSSAVGGGGFSTERLGSQSSATGTRETGNLNLDVSQYEDLLKGGEQVVSVLDEMAKLEETGIKKTIIAQRHGYVNLDKLEDMAMDDASEEIAVQLTAQGVIGKRVDEMESGFMMALDYMIQIAEKDQDEKRKSLLEVVKETVLSHLTKKCPPHVQVVGLLCRTPQKESRHELLRRVAAGGGVFKSENGTKVHLPGANLNDIANQADDLLETMESRPVVPDRKLLARLVLIREEARNMMGGGILDERNDRGLDTLPESEVNFLTKLVALKPGKTVREMIKNVMLGKDEGAESPDSNEKSAAGQKKSGGIFGRTSVSGVKPLPVRPGMFLETVTKVLGGIYTGNISGVTAQHLEWIPVSNMTSTANFCMHNNLI